MNDSKTIWIWAFCSIGLFILFGVVGVHWTYTFSRYKRQMWYQKRYGGSSLIMLSFLLIFTVGGQSLYILWGALLNTNTLEENSSIIKCLRIIESQIFFICTGMCYVLGLYRVWLGYFDICYAKYSFDANWKSIIDPVHFHIDSSFFATYHKTLGNSRWLVLRVGILLIIFYAVRVAVDLINVKHFQWELILETSIAISFCMILGILTLKTPVFEDTIYFREEIRWLPIIICIALVAFCTIAIVYGEQENFAKEMSFAWSRFWMGAMLIYIQSKWVLNKTKKLGSPTKRILKVDNSIDTQTGTTEKAKETITERKENPNQYEFGCACFVMGLSSNSNTRPSELTKTNRSGLFLEITLRNHLNVPAISFESIMSDEHGIELFMKHLNKEFCIELMLSLIEMSQFQQYMLKIFPSLESIINNSTMVQNSIYLPSSLPQSMLVHDREYIEDDVNLFISLNSELNRTLQPSTSLALDERFLYCKLAAFHIFNRYMSVGSEYEINISGRERMKLTRLMQNKTIWLNNKYRRHRNFSASMIFMASLSVQLNLDALGTDDPVDSDPEVVPITTAENLFLLFDPSIYDMITLLRHSFDRFQDTSDYLHYCQKKV